MKELQGSFGSYLKIAEKLGERFRQGKLPRMRAGVGDASVFTIAFDGVFCDGWRGDSGELLDHLSSWGRCFFGVSGGGAGVDDIHNPTWNEGVQAAAEILRREGEDVLGRRLDNCGEAKVLIKICSRIHHDVRVFDLRRYVVGSFETFSPSKLHLKDPCANCQTWVFKVFGEVLCHRSARPGQ